MIRFTLLVGVTLLCGCRSGATTPMSTASRSETPAPRSSAHATTSAVKTARSGPVLEGTILTEAGDPVEGVDVILYGGLATRWEIGRTRTGRAGQYRFAPVPGGGMVQNEDKSWDYFIGVRIEHPNLCSADGLSWWDVRVPAREAAVVRQDFSMIPGATLDAQLIDEQSQTPLAGVPLRVSSPSRDAVRFSRYVETDADGRIELTDLAPGPYIVDINDPERRFPSVGDFTIARAGHIQMMLVDRSRKP